MYYTFLFLNLLFIVTVSISLNITDWNNPALIDIFQEHLAERSYTYNCCYILHCFTVIIQWFRLKEHIASVCQRICTCTLTWIHVCRSCDLLISAPAGWGRESASSDRRLSTWIWTLPRADHDCSLPNWEPNEANESIW